jgi:hypothetical protein
MNEMTHALGERASGKAAPRRDDYEGMSAVRDSHCATIVRRRHGGRHGGVDPQSPVAQALAAMEHSCRARYQ